MRFLKSASVALFAFAMVPVNVQAEEIKVTGVHNCCGACCKLIQDTLGKIEGVSECTAKPKESDFTFEATDAKVARQAVGALARAGFHGKTDKEKLVFRDNSGVDAGKVSRLSLVGIHNCCAGCCKAAKDAIAKVDGVEADSLEPNKRTFVVEGNFDGAAVVKALNDIGFHVRKEGANKNAGKKKKKKDDA
jgi:copper chaperone CopZ